MDIDVVPLKPLDEIFTPADRAFTVMGGNRPVVGIFQARCDTSLIISRSARLAALTLHKLHVSAVRSTCDPTNKRAVPRLAVALSSL